MEKNVKIKCPNCGFLNIKGTKKCSKCKRDIDSFRKSCPRCGKINSNNVKLCIRCKYDFTKKKRTIWFNLFLSLLLMGLLCLLVVFGKEILSWLKWLNFTQNPPPNKVHKSQRHTR